MSEQEKLHEIITNTLMKREDVLGTIVGRYDTASIIVTKFDKYIQSQLHDANNKLQAKTLEVEELKAELAALKPKPAETENVGSHYYPGCATEDFFTSDCKYDCGCWMGSYSSGGPDEIDPFGECPKNSAALESK